MKTSDDDDDDIVEFKVHGNIIRLPRKVLNEIYDKFGRADIPDFLATEEDFQKWREVDLDTKAFVLALQGYLERGGGKMTVREFLRMSLETRAMIQGREVLK